jgi:hypothetical protein
VFIGVGAYHGTDVAEVVFDKVLCMENAVMIIPFQPSFVCKDMIKLMILVNEHTGIICGLHQAIVFVIFLLQFGAVGIVKVLIFLFDIALQGAQE